MRRLIFLFSIFVISSLLFLPYINMGISDNVYTPLNLIDISRLRPVETYSGFLFPRIALPAFITPSSTFNIVLYIPKIGVNVDQVYLMDGGQQFDLDIIDRQVTGNILTLTVAAGNVKEGLYDLYIVSGGKTFVEYNSVSVKATYKYPLKILWYSDTHYDTRRSAIKQRENFLGLIWRANFINPDFVIVTGDVLNTATEENYVSFIKDIHNMLRVPLVLVPGNHDHHFKEDLFTRYLAPSNISINIGSLHLILVDTGPNGMNGWITNSQIEWLREDLSRNSNMEVKIIASHHPFSLLEDSEKSNRAGLEDLLQNSDVDLILHGHMHYSIVEDDKKPLRLTLPNAYEGGAPYTAFRILKVTGPHTIEWRYGGSKDPYPMFKLEVYEYQIQNGSYNGLFLKVTNNMDVDIEGTVVARIKTSDNIITEGISMDELNRTDYPKYTELKANIVVSTGETRVIKIYGEPDNTPPKLVNIKRESSTGKKVTELFYITMEDDVSGIDYIKVLYTLDNESWDSVPVYRLTYNLFYTEVKHEPDKGFALKIKAYDAEGNLYESELLNYSLVIGTAPAGEGGGQPPPIPSLEAAAVIVVVLALVVAFIYRKRSS